MGLNEQTIYDHDVATGFLRIDESGRVWRIARRAGTGLHRYRRPRRAEQRKRTSYGKTYLNVRSKINGVLIATGAQRLVWLHFNGPIPEGLEIDHFDGNPRNNHPENLEPVTTSENIRRSYARPGRRRGGGRPRGSYGRYNRRRFSR